MSYIMQEYICKGKECSNYGKTQERFVERQLTDFEECEICHRPLQCVISAPKGFVIGTDNPCSGQFRN